MSAIFLYAKSKSGNAPHEVNVEIEDGLLLISCSCPAGELQQLCWHVKSLVLGEESALENQSVEQLAGLRTAREWFVKYSLDKDIQRFTTLERTAADLKRELEMMKGKVRDGLMDGFHLSA